MTFVEVHFVTREQLLSLASTFPSAFHAIRWAGIFLALKRELAAIGQFARAVKQSEEKHADVHLLHHQQTQFMGVGVERSNSVAHRFVR